jgi:hypothetical protein
LEDFVGIGRTATVYLNGSPTAALQANPMSLSDMMVEIDFPHGLGSY